MKKPTGIITISDLYEELKKANDRLDRIEKKEHIADQLTVPEAAKILKVDYYWIVDRINSGELPAASIPGKKKTSYRIDPKDFNLFCKRLKLKPEIKPKPDRNESGREFGYKAIGVS